MVPSHGNSALKLVEGEEILPSPISSSSSPNFFHCLPVASVAEESHPVMSQPMVLNVSPSLLLKLIATNYLLRKAQFLPLLRESSSGSEVADPATDLWFWQDQLILSWLISSLSEETLPLVISSRTSADAWQSLVCVFTPSSRSRIMDLKDCLFRLARGTSSISKFLLEACSLADALAVANSPISDEDLVLAVLQGLDDDYKDFSTFVHVRTDPISFLDLLRLLLSQESYLSATATTVIASILTRPTLWFGDLIISF
ncbi:uncharacterized protein LOC122638880 [Telopea speciosissima]|uniref:uncharacterized protein LOC122638880 n=1 Tax=Telopea speciosissima TaxID=54955 RepID=UPI001CC4EFF5|nr:uncharacterized protein LOC122638880 [Telopea speciosissima]